MAKYDIFKFINEIFFTVLMIGSSSYLAAQGKISVGSVLTSYLCFSQLIKPLQELHRILDELSESLILAEDFFKMTDIPHDFSYASVLEKKKLLEDPILRLEHVDLSYDNKKMVLNDINLSVKKGSFIGVAGPSGCGKSSLIKAICKLEKSTGNIIIDGVDLDMLSREEISNEIALVPQNPFLIAGTILENICYGLKTKPTKEEIESTIKRANLKEFIGNLPDGINTNISEGGSNISGGQRQRIALARIFLRKPKILILDEATSALDNTSERYIQKEIELLKNQEQITIISIAHRLTTLQNCDNIFVMNQGKIVQSGTYENLIKIQGIFQDMYYGKLK